MARSKSSNWSVCDDGDGECDGDGDSIPNLVLLLVKVTPNLVTRKCIAATKLYQIVDGRFSTILLPLHFHLDHGIILSSYII